MSRSPHRFRRIAAGGLVSLGAVSMAACGDAEPTQPPTTPPVVTTPVEPTEPPSSTAPGTPSEPTNGGVDYGPLPPKNIDSLKALQPTKFPAAVGTYALKKADEKGLGAATARYEDDAKYTGFLATVQYGTQEYKAWLGDMTDAKYYGNATCGLTDGDIRACVMAGTDEALGVIASNPDVTIEQVAALTQELYDKL